jgi:hypothetical protein
MHSNMVAPFAAVVIKLLQDPLYNDDVTTWNLLLSYTEPVRLYCAQMGLELRVHEEDGFAYLLQPALNIEDEMPFNLPRGHFITRILLPTDELRRVWENG